MCGAAGTPLASLSANRISLQRGGHKPPLLRYATTRWHDAIPSSRRSAPGLACRCPRCGKGRLFQGFLDLRPRCEACGLDYGFADAGDGPAVFIILIAGFIVVGCALDRRVQVRAAALAACGAVAAADPRDHAAAAALDEGPDGRAAVPPQGRRRPSAIETRRDAGAARRLLIPAALALAGLARPGRARHLAARAQGLEGKPDRDAGATAQRRAGRAAAARRMGRHDAGQFGVHPRAAARRVHRATATRWSTPAARRSATTSKAPGYFVFSAGAAARRPAGRGQSRLRAGPSPIRRQPARSEIVGAIRWPEAPSWFVSDHDAAGDIWTCAIHRRWRSARAGARSRRSTSSRRRRCRPAACRIRRRSRCSLRNDHLQYAITWYGLAAVLVGDVRDLGGPARRVRPRA